MTFEKWLQTKLSEGGYPVTVDGIIGRKTIAALQAFQAAHSINPTGTATPETINALRAVSAIASSQDDEVIATRNPPWVAEALRYLGESEGTKAMDKRLNLKSAAIPWCGAFVGMVMATTLPKEALPKNQLWARDWLKFGQKVADPHKGNVAVFSRGSGGHVGFVVGHDKTNLHILGGNQSNSVSIAKIAKSRLLGYRWPVTFTGVFEDMPVTTLAGTVSRNEA
jgi:uncharacterized protein (TIGR02594 family)